MRRSQTTKNASRNSSTTACATQTNLRLPQRYSCAHRASSPTAEVKYLRDILENLDIEPRQRLLRTERMTTAYEKRCAALAMPYARAMPSMLREGVRKGPRRRQDTFPVSRPTSASSGVSGPSSHSSRYSGQGQINCSYGPCMSSTEEVPGYMNWKEKTSS
jgi:hypothetical protein